MSDLWITTEDNPINPFEDFDEWDRWDQQAGYATCGAIARLIAVHNGSIDDLLFDAQSEYAIRRLKELLPLTYRLVKPDDYDGNTLKPRNIEVENAY